MYSHYDYKLQLFFDEHEQNKSKCDIISSEGVPNNVFAKFRGFLCNCMRLLFLLSHLSLLNPGGSNRKNCYPWPLD